MNKLRSIQALRGVAVLSVVAFHALSIEQKYSGGDLLFPDFLRLGQSGVDLFFVISGFVMVTVTKGRFGPNGERMRFLWGRLTRIYPTYWFYFFLTAALEFIIGALAAIFISKELATRLSTRNAAVIIFISLSVGLPLVHASMSLHTMA
jgi:peptidoglycan/LPS O-acetylase OafA/YrhL